MTPTDAPATAAGDDAAAIALAPLTLADPLRWLALGWRDFVRCPRVGLFYGGCFAAMAWALSSVFAHAPAYVMALCGGFLLAGPFLCLGLYRASQRLERGEPATLSDSLLALETRTGSLALFGLVLLILELVWGRATLVVFAVSFDGMPDLHGSLLALADPQNIGFTVAWLAVGAIFAGVIFSVSVVSLPMILDRRTDAITAGLASIRVVYASTGVMLAWGALIVLLVVLAMLPWFAGLVVVGPVLGHATWHAYRSAFESTPR